ncbi:HIT domain-containing protein [Brevibacillus humidisoli]|uniref:HIT family protein n=1 Tax=Brevibacillus humidisoli TaxID=2895522 RepID=UPI001E5496F8|nr:HIT domain-containing protein [Brevibacillus humidisoli]UFJ38919.1 HIT domain-containing protein [Brevibacillus humidisoli]
MSEDFYCEEVLSGNTPVRKVWETERVLAYYHTRPYYEVHIVVIPKRHIASLLTVEEADADLLIEMVDVVKKVASQLVSEYGACRVMTNLGEYQDSKHLHWHVFFGKQIRE